MDNDLAVRIGADLSALTEGLREAASKLSQFVEDQTAALKSIATEATRVVDDVLDRIRSTVSDANQSLDSLDNVGRQQLAARNALDAGRLQSAQRLQQQLRSQSKVSNDLLKSDADKAASDIARIWDKLGSGIADSFGKAFLGIVNGTTSLQKALRQIGQSILDQLVQVAEQMAEQWLVNQAKMTLATSIGAAERQGAEEAASAGSLGASAIKAVAAILNYSFETFAGVFAFLSDLLGPAAAGPAAASQAIVAGAAGSIAFAERGFDVPADTLAFLHKDEMVLPAALAGQLRSMTGAGSTGGGPVINVSFTANGRLSAGEILEHSRTIARAVAREMRQFNPSLRPR
jgi:hypothetical protein